LTENLPLSFPKADSSQDEPAILSNSIILILVSLLDRKKGKILLYFLGSSESMKENALAARKMMTSVAEDR
jgi:hypothetical protein